MNRLLVICLCIAILFAPLGQAEAAADPIGNAVVKVLSQNTSATSKGSGWLLKSESGFFVVTSEHVLIPANLNGRHFIRLAGKSLRCELIATDWARGLSVLKVVDPMPVAGPKLADLEAPLSADLVVGMKVSVQGFPFAQDGEPLGSDGEIAVVDSDRPFLALTHGIELINSHGEYGMSGGPVFLQGSTDATSFVGILSHQVLQVTAGQASQVAAMDPAVVARHLFLVPRQTVFSLLKEALTKSAASPSFVRRSQGSAALELQVGSFTFKETTASSAHTAASSLPPTPAAGLNSGIGGSSVRGGDGGGIGGIEESALSSFSIQIGLNLNPVNNTYTFAQNVFPEWQNILLQRKHVFVTGFLDTNSLNGEMQRRRFNTMQEFVRKLMQPNFQPLISVPENRAVQTELNKKLEVLTNHLLLSMRDLAATGLAEDPLVQKILLQTSLLSEENRSLLANMPFTSFAKLADPRGPYQNSWAILYGRNFDSSVELMRSLNEVANLLR